MDEFVQIYRLEGIKALVVAVLALGTVNEKLVIKAVIDQCMAEEVEA